MRVVAVDVGVTNFAYVRGVTSGRTFTALSSGRINLATFDNCANPACAITRHARDATCRLRHLLLEHPLLETDILVVEQQPPVGMRDVEQALVALAEAAGVTVVVVNPRALHKHYSMGHLDYDGRKARSVEIALSQSIPGVSEAGDRVHDIADAFLMAKYVCIQNYVKEQKEALLAMRQERVRNMSAPNGEPLSDFLDQFKFVPRVSNNFR